MKSPTSKRRPIPFVIAACSLLALAGLPAAADEGFGFGAIEEAAPAASSAAALAVQVGGRVEFSIRSFFEPAGELADLPLSGIPSGRLTFEAKGSSVDASLKLLLSRSLLSESPESLLDEASLRLYLGPLTLEGGLLKLAWGKADSLGPLNVLNPMDYSDLTVTDEREQRLALPMLHASIALGPLSKLELAFLPGFEGDRYAWEGRWTAKAIEDQKAGAYAMFYYGTNPSANAGRGDGLYNSYFMTAWATAYAAAYAQAIALDPNAQAASAAATAAANAAATAQAAAIAGQAASAAQARVAELLGYPDTGSLGYAQGGLRFTTSLGPLDLGLQYFYGFLPKPAVSADPADLGADYRLPVSYNRYHQAGLDFAAVALGLNLRGELAANITEDLKGDEALIYNPAIAWSLGFDRDLFAGINLNLQGSGSYRLFQDKVGSSAYDIEAGTERTKTRITAVLMQKLFKERLDWKLAAIVGLEDGDFLIMPSLGLAVGEARIALEAGIFGGAEAGDLGQYADNSYAELTLGYAF